jgi:PIN domain nuclease of toxin-antitoxin system
LRLFESATLLADSLPPHHRDPFDRMLVCQATAHGLALLTPDPQIAKYAVSVIW